VSNTNQEQAENKWRGTREERNGQPQRREAAQSATAECSTQLERDGHVCSPAEGETYQAVRNRGAVVDVATETAFATYNHVSNWREYQRGRDARYMF